MNKKNFLLYILALCGCFVAGCVLAAALRFADGLEIKPISGGQTLDFSRYGFVMSIPQDYTLADNTQANLEGGGNALYAGSISGGSHTLHLFCYANETGDNLLGYGEQELVSYYMGMGADEVRTRTLGGRRFICYRATVTTDEGDELWDTYETWDETLQLTFETQMPARLVLPILATLSFD